MDEQKNANQQPIDQKQLSVWIGVTIIAIAGSAVVAYILFMAAHPNASTSILGVLK